MEELKLQGIPVYADLATGYFEATEVNIMMNVFRVIDNPMQDIPLAAVLRSPIVGLNDEDLATLRAHGKKGSFYEVMSSFLKGAPLEEEQELHEKLEWFYNLLQGWREFARQQSLSDLIWKVYARQVITTSLAVYQLESKGRQTYAYYMTVQDNMKQHHLEDYSASYVLLNVF